jgi:predicted DNA-binding transcriptional regulator AlpA
MQKIAINENELAQRWGVSPKTLQRWRSEGRGPRYLKLSKRVTYPLDEIFLFEERALHESTWERGSDVAVPSNERLYSAREVATATSLPLYVFTHPSMRKALEIPCIRVGKLVRFNMDEVTAWAKRTHAEMSGFGIQDTSDPAENRRSLLHAIGNLTV